MTSCRGYRYHASLREQADQPSVGTIFCVQSAPLAGLSRAPGQFTCEKAPILPH